MSRAFKSRFLELHVADIPEKELTSILHERCAIAPSHAEKLVLAMRELQRHRQVNDRPLSDHNREERCFGTHLPSLICFSASALEAKGLYKTDTGWTFKQRYMTLALTQSCGKPL